MNPIDQMLPELEAQLFDGQRIRDVRMNNFSQEEATFWAELGVKIGHS